MSEGPTLFGKLLGRTISDVDSATANQTCDNPTVAASAESVKGVVSSALPLVLVLWIGIWLGATASRQNKSILTIITTWFASVFSITKFWVKFRVSTVTNASGKGPKKVAVYNNATNGTTTEMKKNYIDTPREAGVDLALVPKHVAVIMDGNRRYGKRMYGKGSMGHFDGGQKALQVIEWLSTEGVKNLTLYAFSTENWNRESAEVDTLMGLFLQFVTDDLRPVVFNRKVRVKHICTDDTSIPKNLYDAIHDLCVETSVHPANSLTLNVCLSYGSRGEIIQACRSIAKDCANKELDVTDITEDLISERMLTSHSVDPDVLIRTSGEERISNFLLWQLAYTELFFLDKDWPELEKQDFLDVIRTFAKGRQRRFGK